MGSKRIEEIKQHLETKDQKQSYTVSAHTTDTDAVVISPEHESLCDLANDSTDGYVVVGEMCGLAVIRGAHVFAPGKVCSYILHMECRH